MSTMLSGSQSAFDMALEHGDAYYDMKTGQMYRFDEYKFMKTHGAKTSGVYLTGVSNVIEGLWREDDVKKYIKDHNLKLAY